MRPRVGALVEQGAGTERDQLPVLRRGIFDVPLLLTRVVERDQVLAAILDPFDRPAEPDRQPWDQVVLGIELPAGAEAAADVALDAADRLGLDIEHRREDLAVEVLDLGRPPDRQLGARCVVLGDQAARLERHRAVSLDAELPPQDHGRLLKQLIDALAVGRLHAVDHVGPEHRVDRRR